MYAGFLYIFDVSKVRGLVTPVNLETSGILDVEPNTTDPGLRVTRGEHLLFENRGTSR